MTPEEFVDAVRDDNETALSRLGSSKSVYADTGGEMTGDAVLSAAADAEHHAAETFAAWAEDTADERAAAVFETTAAEERDHHPSETVPAIQAHLRSLDEPVERLGGLVGRTLAAEKSKQQLTAFFTGEADPATAGTFRQMGDELDAQLERAVGALAEVCEDDADWERAREVAGETIKAAYDEYTERLESMGVNPKPVC